MSVLGAWNGVLNEYCCTVLGPGVAGFHAQPVLPLQVFEALSVVQAAVAPHEPGMIKNGGVQVQPGSAWHVLWLDCAEQLLTALQLEPFHEHCALP